MKRDQHVWKESYMHEKRLDYLVEKRPTKETTWLKRDLQKRPMYLRHGLRASIETHERDLQKRLLGWKETHTPEKRSAHEKRPIHMKRDPYTWNETHTHEKRPTHMKRNPYTWKESYAHEKRLDYLAEKRPTKETTWLKRQQQRRPTYLRRGLRASIETHNV